MKKIEVYEIASNGAAGALKFTIGDNTAARGAGGWITSIGNGQIDSQAEEITIPDSIYPVIYDRGNATAELRPVVDYGFSTEALRDAFILTLESTLPRVGHVKITAGSHVIWITSAKLRPVTWQVVGEVAVEVTFTIRGQRMIAG